MFAILFALLLSFFRIGVDARLLAEQQEIVTTIQSKQGQIYDCVDFFKQPAFAHPLLKHPASRVRRSNPKEAQAKVGGEKPRGIGLDDGGCPTGTIPILRVNANYTSHHSSSLVTSPNDDFPDICIAVVRTKGDPNKKFLGVEGWPSLYKPKVDGSINQYSAARIKLSNGADSIEVGWMVNPSLFKDDEAHLYVRFTAGDKGCINTQCPGFVHVAKDVPLGFVPDRYSTIGGDQFVWKIFIDKHEDDGNWWVSMDSDKYKIGYWPKNLFTGLADFANQVEWGGEVGVHSNLRPGKWDWPEMGNGRRAVYDTQHSANFQHATLVNEGHQSVNPDDTERFETREPVYHVLDAGNKGDYFGRLIFFGGPNWKTKTST